MKDLLAWWFYPKQAKRFSSVIKIVIGLLIVYSFFSTFIGNMADLINAYENPPQYLDMSYLLLPIVFLLFIEAVFWGGLFCLPYYLFGKRSERSEGYKGYLMPILLSILIIGSFIARGAFTKPDIVEITRTQLALLENRLGGINAMGEFYTLREFSADIDRLTKSMPDFFLTKEEGFSDLVVFYLECEDSWQEYYELFPTDSKGRERWRLEHPEVEAMLIFWGKYNKSVFTKNSAGGKEVLGLLNTWASKYNITRAKDPRASWEDLVPIR